GYDVVDLGVMVPKEKILEQAVAEKADIVGLSGLITPSLDEMVDVAREMKRRGMELPLLIGGATTSRIHTAVKIAPQYASPTVHVLGASRAVGVVGNLLDANRRDEYNEKVKAEYERARTQHEKSNAKVELLPLEEARSHKPILDWTAENIPQPE